MLLSEYFDVLSGHLPCVQAPR